MHPTRQLWAVIGLVVFLALFGALTAHPLPLGGAGLLGAWVLMRQYRFLRTLETTVDSLQVHQSSARSGIRTDDSVPVTLTATLETDSYLSLNIDAGVPTAAVSESPLSVSLQPGESNATRTVEFSWPVAGNYEFDKPSVTATDGFICETVAVGTAPTVTVEPRGPRTIHVGEGGNRVTTAYGEHEAGQLGSGLEPAELREYVPGDRTDRIDWKATARLSTPHVREYEAETDRRTLLIVDHRASLETGSQGETKLAYLRDVALAIAASARRLGDPIGLVGIGENGITCQIDPATTPATYKQIRRQLLSFEPTQSETTKNESTASSLVPSQSSTDAESVSQQTRSDQFATRITAADAREKLEAIRAESNTFAETLRPFYTARQGYQKRIETDPLYGALSTVHSRVTEGWTIICTDDTKPAELRETVKLARKNSNMVLVLIAPTVLYEPGSLTDVEQAYDRYVQFEELRRDLARMTHVTALEAGPKDRLSTVLSANRRGRYA